MPKRTNVNRNSTGADISDVADLHCKMVEAASFALDQEMSNGEIKAATLNTVRQICADSGVLPTPKASDALDRLNSVLPVLNVEAIARMSR